MISPYLARTSESMLSFNLLPYLAFTTTFRHTQAFSLPASSRSQQKYRRIADTTAAQCNALHPGAFRAESNTANEQFNEDIRVIIPFD